MAIVQLYVNRFFCFHQKEIKFDLIECHSRRQKYQFNTSTYDIVSNLSTDADTITIEARERYSVHILPNDMYDTFRHYDCNTYCVIYIDSNAFY